MKKKLRIINGKIKDYYAFSSGRRTTTYAGGLAYFFFSGLVPFFGLISAIALLLGFDVETAESLFDNSVLSSYFDIINEEAANGASTVVMLLVAAYSSTHFYFHLIRTGEGIYGCNSSSGPIKRVLSFIYLSSVQILMIGSVAAVIVGKRVLAFIGFSAVVVNCLMFFSSVAFYLGLSLLLHLFAAPSGRKKIGYIGRGALFTLAYWEICGLFFNIYLSFKTENRSVFAAIAAFLLYLYFLMRGLTFGIAVNAMTNGENSIITDLEKNN